MIRPLASLACIALLAGGPREDQAQLPQRTPIYSAGEVPWQFQEVRAVTLPAGWTDSNEVFPGQLRVLPDGKWLLLSFYTGTVWARTGDGDTWEEVTGQRAFRTSSVVVSATGEVLFVDQNLVGRRPGANQAVYPVAGSGSVGIADGRAEGDPSHIAFVQRSRGGEATEVLRVVMATAEGESLVLYTTELPGGHFADFPACGLSDVLVRPLLAPRLEWAVSPGTEFLAAGNTSESTVTLFDLSKGEQRQIRLRSRRSVSEPRSLARRVLGTGWRVGNCTVPVSEALRGRGVYGEIPSLLQLGVDRSGNLWVGRPTVSSGHGLVTEIYNAEGQFVGTVPERIAFPVAFSSSGFVGWRRDAEGAPQLVAYRIKS